MTFLIDIRIFVMIIYCTYYNPEIPIYSIMMQHHLRRIFCTQCQYSQWMDVQSTYIANNIKMYLPAPRTKAALLFFLCICNLASA